MGNGFGYFTEKPNFGLPAGGQQDWRTGIYGGDTWKVSRDLTVNYGMRWDRDTGRTDSDLAPIPCSDAVTARHVSGPLHLWQPLRLAGARARGEGSPAGH